MSGDLWFFCQPLVLSDLGTLSKTTGRTDLVPDVIGNATASPAGDMPFLVPLPH